jgi:putative transcriptional regulator
MKILVKNERSRVEITQQQLADAIGVSRQTINSIESGRYVPSTMLALKISGYFKKTVNELFVLEKAD